MRKIIINAFGPDKTGIVYQLSKIILGLNGNIENSKMIRMESDFAILMLVAISKNNISELENNFSLKKLIRIDLLRVVYSTLSKLNAVKSNSQILL